MKILSLENAHLIHPAYLPEQSRVEISAKYAKYLALQGKTVLGIEHFWFEHPNGTSYRDDSYAIHNGMMFSNGFLEREVPTESLTCWTATQTQWYCSPEDAIHDLKFSNAFTLSRNYVLYCMQRLAGYEFVVVPNNGFWCVDRVRLTHIHTIETVCIPFEPARPGRWAYKAYYTREEIASWYANPQDVLEWIALALPAANEPCLNDRYEDPEFPHTLTDEERAEDAIMSRVYAQILLTARGQGNIRELQTLEVADIREQKIMDLITFLIVMIQQKDANRFAMWQPFPYDL